MRALLACFTALMLANTASFAAECVFAELEEVYLTVLADSISEQNASDLRLAVSNRVYAVSMGNTEMDNGKFIPVPDALWKKLSALLKNKGIDPKQFVSLSELEKQDNKGLAVLIHKATGKKAGVFSISGISWNGNDQLLVDQSVYHGELAASGCTYILEKKNGKWTVVNKTGLWIS